MARWELGFRHDPGVQERGSRAKVELNLENRIGQIGQYNPGLRGHSE